MLHSVHNIRHMKLPNKINKEILQFLTISFEESFLMKPIKSDSLIQYNLEQQ